ncbi:MAG TPA: Gmad2 immunoglobulin-like domain-containing protein [Ktedonobacteraceae bacterium]|jgi:hypothetical protein|nr:Gmad2 immunoglobulin-like domain-containing protein [Ktedonobacteraceae bacterium]
MTSLSARRYKQSFFTAGFLCLFVYLLAACGPGGSTVSPSSTAPSNTAPTATPQATPSAGVKLGVQPCPVAVQSPTYWAPLVGVQPDVNKVGSVTCANLIGQNELQALVTVQAPGTDASLDLHVFTHITQPQPVELFKLQSLLKGNARISGYNTIMTAEVDHNSSVNKGITANASLQQDLFREFKWSDSAGTFVPVVFPGLYPDLTRFQAETDQQNVNQGQDAWKLSATQTASNLTVNLLKWPAADNTTVVSGGGKSDSDAVVNVKNPGVDGGTVQVTMSRLEGNTNGGIWIVTDVGGAGMDITTPITNDRISSPAKVAGKGRAFESVIGRVVILDHTYTDIGDVQARGTTGMGNATFTANVTYNSTFKNGAQEGIIALYSYSNADGSIASAVMHKVLIGL